MAGTVGLFDGARCPKHPDRNALGACGRCGTFVCAECASTRDDGQLACPACTDRVPQYELADRATRFWANLIDTLVFVAPLIAGMAANALKGSGDREAIFRLLLSLAGTLTSLIVLGVQVMLTRSGQSIGKKLGRIRVVKSDGSPATMTTIIVMRNLLPLLIRAVPVVGNFFVLADSVWIFGDNKKCLHDLIAGTKVVKLPTETRSVSPEVRVSG